MYRQGYYARTKVRYPKGFPLHEQQDLDTYHTELSKHNKNRFGLTPSVQRANPTGKDGGSFLGLGGAGLEGLAGLLSPPMGGRGGTRRGATADGLTVRNALVGGGGLAAVVFSSDEEVRRACLL